MLRICLIWLVVEDVLALLVVEITVSLLVLKVCLEFLAIEISAVLLFIEVCVIFLLIEICVVVLFSVVEIFVVLLVAPQQNGAEVGLLGLSSDFGVVSQMLSIVSLKTVGVLLFPSLNSEVLVSVAYSSVSVSVIVIVHGLGLPVVWGLSVSVGFCRVIEVDEVSEVVLATVDSVVVGRLQSSENTQTVGADDVAYAHTSVCVWRHYITILTLYFITPITSVT